MRIHKLMPPLDYVESKVAYNEAIGELIWISGPRKGKIAGSKNKKYRYVEFYIEGKREPYVVHRVIWFLKTGEDPGDAVVDHRDGDGFNNFWDNLRITNYSGNGKNKKCTTNNTGFTGVVRRGDRYMAYAFCDGKQVIFGRTDTPEEAHQLYLEGIDALFGDMSPSERYKK